MPTQIIDGFKLNAATPIDSRLVTTGTASRNSMTYKYEGLRVYDTVQKMPFVYINSAWVEESGSSTTSGGGSGTSMLLGGTENYIPKITSTGTTNSIIREYEANANDRRIGINVGTSQIDATLHLKGNSKFEGQVTATNFVGEISGNNVSFPVGIIKLDNPTSNGTYILKSINKQNQWVAETTGENIIITKNTNDSLLYLVLSKEPVATTGNNLYITNYNTSELIAANAKTRQLMLGTGNVFSLPQYSFSGNTNTGMYGNSAEIGLTLGGSKRIYVESNTVGINVGGTAIAKFETGTMSITGATNITGNTTILGNTSITGTATINGATNITGTTTITGNTTISASTATINATTETTITTPTLKINGSTIVGTMATLTGTLTIDGEGLLRAKQVNLKKDESGQVLTVSASQSTSPPNMIINHCGTGLYVRGGTGSIGESLRLDSNAVYQNFISFYKNKEGVSTAHAANTDRLGWIGYGSTLNSTLGFYNDSGDILIKAPTKTVTTQWGDLTYTRKITIESSSISLDGGVTTNGNLTVATGYTTTLGGTTNINGTTTITGANTFTVGTGKTNFGGDVYTNATLILKNNSKLAQQQIGTWDNNGDAVGNYNLSGTTETIWKMLWNYNGPEWGYFDVECDKWVTIKIDKPNNNPSIYNTIISIDFKCNDVVIEDVFKYLVNIFDGWSHTFYVPAKNYIRIRMKGANGGIGLIYAKKRWMGNAY